MGESEHGGDKASHSRVSWMSTLIPAHGLATFSIKLKGAHEGEIFSYLNKIVLLVSCENRTGRKLY